MRQLEWDEGITPFATRVHVRSEKGGTIQCDGCNEQIKPGDTYVVFLALDHFRRMMMSREHYHHWEGAIEYSLFATRQRDQKRRKRNKPLTAE